MHLMRGEQATAARADPTRRAWSFYLSRKEIRYVRPWPFSQREIEKTNRRPLSSQTRKDNQCSRLQNNNTASA